MRVGYIHDWKSNWFNEQPLRRLPRRGRQPSGRTSSGKLFGTPGLSKITIRKDANEVEVNINTARPGIVIGKCGSEVDALRRELHRMTKSRSRSTSSRSSVRSWTPAWSRSRSPSSCRTARVPPRDEARADLRHALGRQGLKIQVSGRLGGAEMARTECYSDGRVPLHTMRADIDYGFFEARTTFGRIA